MLLKNLLINSSWPGTKYDDTKYQLLPLCTFQVFEGSQIEMIVVIER
jgi:hypothetical protein